MYHVYLLKNKKNSSLDVGYTNDIKRRLKEYNERLVGYTKKYAPWAFVYYESCFSLEDVKASAKGVASLLFTLAGHGY